MSLMRRMRSELDWPESFFGRRLVEWPEPWSGWLDETALRVEEFEENGQMVVRAELPGIDPDKDVEITVLDNTLRIKAERREETKAEDKKGYRSEFRYGSFVRAVTLPAGATAQDVKAAYHDGILEVRLPISAEQAEAKKIPITRG